MNVQAVSGPNIEIQNIVARWLGSVHDARIFNISRLCASSSVVTSKACFSVTMVIPVDHI